MVVYALTVSVVRGVMFRTQGETIAEVLENLREATELYLDEFPMSC